MARRFTRTELLSATVADVAAMSAEDRAAFDSALLEAMVEATAEREEIDNRRDGADWEHWA